MHPLEQTDQTFKQITLRYEPWSDWNPSFFPLCNKINYIGKATVLVTLIFFLFFSHQIMQLKLLAHPIKDQVILIHFEIFVIS